MATIQARKTSDGKTTYRVMVRLKGHPAQSATFERKTDAKRWAAQTESAIREGRHFKTTEAKRHTVKDLLDRYEREILPSKAPGTQRPQATQLAWWRDQIGEYSLDACTPSMLAERRALLASEAIPSTAKDPAKAGPPRYRSAGTINRYTALLSHAFSVAVREYEWITENPVERMTKGKESRGRVRFLSDDTLNPDGSVTPGERSKLLAACQASASPDLYPAVVLALSTGARQQEILGLRWPQVDLARRVAILHKTKNHERRVLPLVGPALEILKERAQAPRADTDLVFPARKVQEDGTIEPVDLRTPFKTALKRAGIADFRWHDLRHTTGSYLAMNGASLPEIAEVLGHKTLAMVKRYAHLSEAHTAGVVERMNRAMFGEEAKL